jgi:hypothetical protein
MEGAAGMGGIAGAAPPEAKLSTVGAEERALAHAARINEAMTTKLNGKIFFMAFLLLS